MADTSILAVLNRSETARPVLVSAGLLAARLPGGGARIDALHIRPAVDPDFMPTEEMMTENRRRRFEAWAEERSADLKRFFDAWARARQPGGAAAWREVVGRTKAVVAAEGSRTDLIVIGRAASEGHDYDGQEATQAALFDARAPVVLVPEAVPRTLGQHPAIAWKPSRAADQAVQAALPILLAADRVTVLIAAEDGVGEATPYGLQDALARQVSRLEVRRFDPEGRGIGEVLLAEAKRAGADLLVMGAYTHSRLVETVLGGATRDILAGDAALPVLMHH